MTSLYNCRHSGDQYRISKFDSHFDLESSYLCTESECECPAGHRPTCRHREMLPKFIQRSHIGDEWFFDFDRGGWIQGQVDPDNTSLEGLAPQAPTTPAQVDSDLLGNLGKSNQRLIAEAQPLAIYSGPNAPDLASEASALGVPATVASIGTIRRRI